MAEVPPAGFKQTAPSIPQPTVVQSVLPQGGINLGRDVSMSPDGRFVAMKGDDVFMVYDRVSRSGERFEPPLWGRATRNPTISADGRYIAFHSDNWWITPDDRNSAADIFLFDRTTRTAERLSDARGGGPSNGESFDPVISADGRRVAFYSEATNLAPGHSRGGGGQFYFYDRATRQVEPTLDALGNQFYVAYPAEDGGFPRWDMSADARRIVFESDDPALAQGDTNGQPDIFLYDHQTNAIRRVSMGVGGQQSNGPSHFPRISADGRYVSFRSEAANLVPGVGGAGDERTFLLELQTGAVEVIPDGAAISGDARYVVSGVGERAAVRRPDTGPGA